MPCNDRATDCAPCQDCPPSPQPVLPRCQDVVLTDGTFINASVVVSQGCIVQVAAGEEMAYQPDNCCGSGSGGGGGSDGLMGPPGPAGAPATITIGTVTSAPPATPPLVTNSGTPSNAILNFVIPSGADGADGEGLTGLDITAGGWEIEAGAIKTLPANFPPIGTVVIGPSDVAGISITAVKDNPSGSVTLTLSALAFNNLIMGYISGLQTDVLTASSTASWGSINGNINTQPDLTNALSKRPPWTMAETAPAAPVIGDRWYKPSTGVESVWAPAGANPPAWITV